MTDVSIIIVNWNTRDLLRECLRSVHAETRDVSFETIVVDNASTDGSPAMVAEEFPGVKVIANDANRGFAAGNNQGLAAATGRYALLLNSDTVVLDRAIERVVAFADRHGEAGVVGCRIRNADGSLQPSCSTFPSLTNLALMATYLYRLFPRNRFAGRDRMTWWGHDGEREVEVMTGCFLLVRREVVEKVGGFNESYFFGGEEVDWCRRIGEAGWKLMFTPSATITHLGGASARSLGWRIDALQTRATIRLFRDHYGPARAAAAAALLWFFNFTHMLAWRSVAACSPSRRAAALERSLHFRNVLAHWRAPVESLRSSGREAARAPEEAKEALS